MPVTVYNYNLLHAERMLIDQAMTASRGIMSQAAAHLGITRHALRRRLTKHKLSAEGYRNNSARHSEPTHDPRTV
jgi:DNA-binding protein Fis